MKIVVSYKRWFFHFRYFDVYKKYFIYMLIDVVSFDATFSTWSSQFIERAGPKPTDRPFFSPQWDLSEFYSLSERKLKLPRANLRSSLRSF